MSSDTVHTNRTQETLYALIAALGVIAMLFTLFVAGILPFAAVFVALALAIGIPALLATGICIHTLLSWHKREAPPHSGLLVIAALLLAIPYVFYLNLLVGLL